MNKEKIEQLVRGFCEAENIDYWQEVEYMMSKSTTVNKVGIPELFIKFLQSMIEEAEVVEADRYERLQIMYNLSESQLHETHVLLHEAKNSEPSISSAGKEVKTAKEIIEKYGWHVGDRSSIIPAMEEYANQFKSTPSKVISEGLSKEDIKTRADKYMKACECTNDEYVGYITGADWANNWYRDQLKQNP